MSSCQMDTYDCCHKSDGVGAALVLKASLAQES